MVKPRSLFTYLKSSVKELNCPVCNESLKNNTEDIILCNHHKGAVHIHCCINTCSRDHEPCRHSLGMYRKAEYSESW